MISKPDLERCRSFIHCHLGSPSKAQNAGAKLAITLSRETGTGGRVIAQVLADYLQQQGPNREYPWTVFDRNLVEKVIEDHSLPKDLARFMPEDRISQIGDVLEDLFGLHPPAWTLVRRAAETMLKLVELGNVILVGRGANFVTRRLPHVFHVRLVGTLERRIERLCRFDNLDPKSARAEILRSDQARERYVLQHLRQHIEMPHHYDLVLNTDRLTDQTAAKVIGDTVLQWAAQSATRPELAHAA